MLRFVSIFSGFGATNLRPAAGALVCNTNRAVVAQMDKSGSEVVRFRFASQGTSEAPLDLTIFRKPKWYKIVILKFRHLAIVLFKDTSNASKNVLLDVN